MSSDSEHRQRQLEKQKEIIKFSTGKEIKAFMSIVGICHDLDVSFGSDDSLSTPHDARCAEDADANNYSEVTSSECIELADIMIERWTKFKQKHAALVEQVSSEKKD